MSMKEFDYKQFLLEKGERVGLVVAVTLMVLMLIKSLFMPESGFFSGSPSEKARALRESTQRLDSDLHNKNPGPDDLPKSREERLINLDTRELNSDQYRTQPFYEPRIRENPNRRPPSIYNVEEAIAEVVHVPIDTYLWQDNFKKIWVLTDKSGQRTGGAGPGGGSNPLKGGMPGGGMMGGGMNPMMQQMMRQQQQRLGGNLQGARQLAAGTEGDYEIRTIPTENWNPSELTARQLRPCRMAIIAGSFPYRKQLEEHKNKLRLKSTDEVLGEEVEGGEGGKKLPAFRFLGIEVERKEVDAKGNNLKDSDWTRMDLGELYRLWLLYTYYPFETEDPKLAQVRLPGLVAPLLREFHANPASASGGPAMAGPAQPQPKGAAAAAEGNESKSNSGYPDIVAKLPKVQETLAKLNDSQPKTVALPKFVPATIDNPFNPNAPAAGDKQQSTTANDKSANAAEYIPEHVLARVMDVSIEPNKFYRYRIRIKMANPNFKKADVASPEYKEGESLESKEWYELPQTVSVPSETLYYVVDEKQGKSMREINREILQQSAQYEMWKGSPNSDQVVMQFHRWVESTQRSRTDPDVVPVAEWTVADRVLVSRGEYIGRKVKIDLPIWIYTRNAYILPVEDVKKGRRLKNTGIDVEFGSENPEENTILVDFEGGRVSSPTAKIDDVCGIEALMMSPDGKLLARNSAKDTSDQDRVDRRKQVMERIMDVRTGKKE